MFSTDRSEAKTCECVAQNNLYISKSGAFNHDIIMYRYIKINRIVKIGLKAGGIYENPPDINFISTLYQLYTSFPYAGFLCPRTPDTNPIRPKNVRSTNLRCAKKQRKNGGLLCLKHSKKQLVLQCL